MWRVYPGIMTDRLDGGEMIAQTYSHGQPTYFLLMGARLVQALSGGQTPGIVNSCGYSPPPHTHAGG